MLKNNIVPNYSQLIEVTYIALKELGGSGKNNEINEKAALLMNLSDEILSIPHLGNTNLSEVNYRLAWARTLLKNHGAIENSARSVWSITPAFSNKDKVDGEYIEKNCRKANINSSAEEITEKQMEEAGVEIPEEIKPWRKKLRNVLVNMNKYESIFI